MKSMFFNYNEIKLKPNNKRYRRFTETKKHIYI